MKKQEKFEVGDNMGSVTVETEQEDYTPNKLEVLNYPNIPIDTKSLDLVSNTDLFSGENSQLIEKKEYHVENSEEFKFLEKEILKADETGEKEINDLFLLDNGEKMVNDPAQNLEKQMKDNEGISASLFDFGMEEPKTGSIDITSNKKTCIVEIADIESYGMERINTQELLFLETVNNQNVPEHPMAENVSNL